MKKLLPVILLLALLALCPSPFSCGSPFLSGSGPVSASFLWSTTAVAGRPSAGAPAAPRARQDGGSKRDAWQRPDEVFQALGIGPGSAVADVGCGDGYFVSRLARRVGREGVVYAEDVDDEVLAKVRRKVDKEKFAKNKYQS